MSLTAGERQALLWLLAVIAVGTGVRVVRHRGERGADAPAADEALRQQLLAVDSAQRASHRPARRARGAGNAGPTTRRSRRPRPADSSAISRSRSASPDTVPRLTTVDVDVADSAALERLPRIGPALAARIVADRHKRGAFGSADGLQRVRGIGPKLAALLAPLVTFSGTPRPSVVQR